MKQLNTLLIACLLSTLLTACQGSYLNNMVILETHTATNPALTAEIRQDKNTRPAEWGECDHWKQLHLVSDNDVDTAYNRLIRHEVLQIGRIPQTESNTQLDQRIARLWALPSEYPGLMYAMPPRWTNVKVNDYDQLGVVAYRITKNNRGKNQGSLIDVEYCAGGSYELGFYLPPQIEKGFEPALKKKFETALNARF